LVGKRRMSDINCVYKVPYKGNVQELSNYVLDNINCYEWAVAEKAISYTSDGNKKATYSSVFDLPQKYKDILTDSLGYNLISECFLWHYPDTVELSIHRDKSPYMEKNMNQCVGYWTAIIPIVDVRSRIDVWEPIHPDANRWDYEQTEYAANLANMRHDHFKKIKDLEYEIGDVVMLANQTHFHSVESETTGKMSLHFFVDKPL